MIRLSMSQSHYHVYLPPVLSALQTPIPRLSFQELNVDRDVDPQFDFGRSSQVSRIKRVTSRSQGSTQVSQVQQVQQILGNADHSPIADSGHRHGQGGDEPASAEGNKKKGKRSLTNDSTTSDVDLDIKPNTTLHTNTDRRKGGLSIKRSRAPLTLSLSVDEGDSLGDGSLGLGDNLGSGSGSRRRSTRISRSGSNPGTSFSLLLLWNFQELR